MSAAWLVVAAYAVSGLAGIVYEVCWTRQLTLYMGHTTAAASTVLAAFMGGMAVGSAISGRLAGRLDGRRALRAYAVLELVVVAAALLIPSALARSVPLLRSVYAEGSVRFGVLRFIVCTLLLAPAAAALGATYPMTIAALAGADRRRSGFAGVLYAANTSGAALGSVVAGFVLIPALGILRTTLVGVLASLLAALVAWMASRRPAPSRAAEAVADTVPGSKRPARAGPGQARSPKRGRSPVPLERAAHPGTAAAVLAVTGFAMFLFEVAWTRVFSMVLGPSTYAFSAMLGSVIVSLAVGAVIGSALSDRLGQTATPLACAIAMAAAAAAWSTRFAGGGLPSTVFADLTNTAGALALVRLWTLALIVVAPVTIPLGAAFPLAIGLARPSEASAPSSVGALYAINTVAAVLGSLTAGFLLIPLVGLQRTLIVATMALLGAVAVVAVAASGRIARVAAPAVAVGAAMALMFSPPWDRPLLASGLYKYTRYAAATADPRATLTAGTILYYREGASGTVTVRKLTGALSLAIDGKVDASNGGDMLTQKLLAHLPLLLHRNPRTVGIIGLGSGVTAGAALVHPVERVDVIEISPEVIEASHYFDRDNHQPLADPRTRLIVGDGRSHLTLSAERYDVIVSEPSNPWMAGIASLFTREFFAAARARLAPEGILCQWAHTYDISDRDLRSIAATFAEAFPNGTMWLVGDSDLLLIGSDQDLTARLGAIQDHWARPGVAADLKQVSVTGPFGVWAQFIGGPEELRRYSRGAPVQTDDRMALEFSGPRALYGGAPADNVGALRTLMTPAHAPPIVRHALETAAAADWRDYAATMMLSGSYGRAYEMYEKALTADPADAATLGGIVPAAVAAHRATAAARLFDALEATRPGDAPLRIAHSKLLASAGDFDGAVARAKDGCRVSPDDIAPWAQLASVYADAGAVDRLSDAVAAMRRIDAESAATLYYTAAAAFMQGRPAPARAAIERAIAADPSRADAHNLLGVIHANAGATGAARDQFHKALELNPRDATAYANLGLFELNHGDREAARGWFAEALALDPQSHTAREGLEQARAR